MFAQKQQQRSSSFCDDKDESGAQLSIATRACVLALG
jgi:hypothetical protein